MAKKLVSKKEVDEKLTWDLTAIYSTEEEYKHDVKKMQKLAEVIEKQYKGKLNSAAVINNCINDYRKLYEIMTLTIDYADLAVSVDYSDENSQNRLSRVSSIMAAINSNLSFIESELIKVNDKFLDEAITLSKDNSCYLKNIKEKKLHALNPEAERVIKALDPVLQGPLSVYRQLKHSDMNFDDFTVDGTNYVLSYASYEGQYSANTDTKVRRAAFNAFSNKIRQYQYGTATAYNLQVQKEKIISHLRGYNSIFDYLLADQKVTIDMYNRQIDLIMEKLAPHMRKYVRLLKKVYNLDEMTFADLLIPLDSDYNPKVTIEEAKKYVENGLAVLGDDYNKMINAAFKERWVDFANNKGKSTGGFCESPYGTHSYILLNWDGTMGRVCTLAHELGHAGHFYLCNKAQNIFDTEVSMYFLEAPSTMNHLLMANYLIETNKDKKFRRWVLSTIVFRNYYHNFVTHLLEAAYQREVYKIIDKGGSVQAPTLNKLKKETLEKFWGDDVKINDGAELTWMRQIHYYAGLYSYTYSAGLTIATEVSKRILKEGQPAVDDWLKTLAAGSTKTPMELAKMAGVDISTDKPLLDTIDYIGSVIDEIIKLTEEIDKQ